MTTTATSSSSVPALYLRPSPFRFVPPMHTERIPSPSAATATIPRPLLPPLPPLPPLPSCLSRTLRKSPLDVLVRVAVCEIVANDKGRPKSVNTRPTNLCAGDTCVFPIINAEGRTEEGPKTSLVRKQHAVEQTQNEKGRTFKRRRKTWRWSKEQDSALTTAVNQWFSCRGDETVNQWRKEMNVTRGNVRQFARDTQPLLQERSLNSIGQRIMLLRKK